MATPVILTSGKIQIAPGTKILKGEEYAQYLKRTGDY